MFFRPGIYDTQYFRRQRTLSGGRYITEYIYTGPFVVWDCTDEELSAFSRQCRVLIPVTALSYIAAVTRGYGFNHSIWVGLPSLFAVLSWFYLILGLMQMHKSRGNNQKPWFETMQHRIEGGSFVTAGLMLLTSAVCLGWCLLNSSSDGLYTILLYIICSICTLVTGLSFRRLSFMSVPNPEAAGPCG